MLFIEDDNFLKQEHKDFIKNVILNCEFPFFIQQYTTEKDDETSGVLVHTLAKRLENRSQDEWLCSEYGHIFLDMAETFFKKNNISYKTLHRAAVNFTYNTGTERCSTHLDHDFPHKQLLVYLNEVKDKNSKTVILDNDEKTVLKEVYPKEYKGVCFDAKPHFHIFPKVGSRIVFVITFD